MRMKKQCAVFLTVLLALTSVLFSGCGKKVTAEELMKEVKANMEKVTSMSMDIDADISMGIKQSGVGLDLDVTMSMKTEQTKDPEAAHMTGTVSMSLLGMNVDMESYSVVENGKTAVYTNTAGEWTRTESELPDENSLNEISEMFSQNEEYKLQDKTEKLDGKEVYVLNTTISGEYMESIMGQMNSAANSGVDGADWSGVKIDSVIKIDAEKKLPVEMILDCGDSMSELMKNAMGASGSSDAEISVNEFVMTITFGRFNEIDEIKVPEEAKAAAVTDGGEEDGGLESFLNGSISENDGERETDPAVGIPQGTDSGEEDEDTIYINPDGSYQLENFWDDGTRVNIRTPEGFAFNEYSDNTYFMFDYLGNQDFESVVASYMLDSDYTEEEMEEYYMDDVKYYQEDEDYSNVEVQTKQLYGGGNHIWSFIKVSYTYDETSNYIEYFAWTILEDGRVVQCEIEDYAYEQECSLIDDSILETVLGALAE